jgi:putative hemolysin
MESTIEILIILALILLNAVFAAAEIAMVSARKPRLQAEAEKGDRRAEAALRLAEKQDVVLSTTQIGITLVAILSGAFAGATLSDNVALALANIPALEPYARALSLVLVVGAITFLSVVVGEIVPKQLALRNPEAWAMRFARPMGFMSKLLAPVVAVLSGSANGLLKLLGGAAPGAPAVTEEELHVLIAQGQQAGLFSEAEGTAVRGVFRLGDRRTSAIMTPRMEMDWLEASDPWDETWRRIIASGHSRYPLCEGGLDHVIGIVEAQDLVACGQEEGAPGLRSAAQEAAFAPESLPAVELIGVLRHAPAGMALVVDEFGGVQGLVTAHDLLFATTLDITEGTADEEPQAVRRADGSWIVDGLLDPDDLRRTIALTPLPGEDAGHYETLGGFVMAHLGRIPVEGDAFEAAGWRFEVLDMDGRRVDKVLLVAVDEGVSSGAPGGP